MTPRKLIFLFAAIVLLAKTGLAYEPVSDNEQFFLKHLQQKVYPIDSNAGAVTLLDLGNFALQQRSDGGYYMNITARRVVKILKADQVKQAEVEIPYLSKEKVSGNALKVKARTYNLVNGAVKVTEVAENAIVVKDGENEYVKLVTFTLPEVAPGSVIDYSYEINQEAGFRLADWSFQDEVPVLHSELTITYPEGILISVYKKTSQPFVIFDEKDIAGLPDSAVPLAYTTEPKNVAGKTTLKWVRRNLGLIKEEPHNYNLGNYVERLTVHIAGTTFDAGSSMLTWETLNKQVYGSFSDYLDNLGSNMAAKDLREKMFKGHKFDKSVDSAKHVYNYIKKHFTIVADTTAEEPEGKIEKVILKKSGNSTEVNLLLVKLFNEMGYPSNLVFLATRNSQRLSAEYPAVENLNYAVCRTEIGDERYYLDAGAKYYPFGVLKPECYNGFSWAIGNPGFRVNISPDEIKERALAILTTENAEKDNYVVKLSVTMGDVSGPEHREKWAKDSAGIKAYAAQQLKALPFKYEMLDYQVENLADADHPLKVHIRAKLTWPAEGKISMVPSVVNYYTENPFESMERTTPVEMPCALDVNYMLTLKLPEGYKIEQSPESKALKLDSRNGYKYLAEYKDETNTLTVSTRLQMANTFFERTNYHALQSFFDKVIEQQGSKVTIAKAAGE